MKGFADTPGKGSACLEGIRRKTEMNDEEIVRLLGEKDETALTALNTKYGPKCRAIARDILGSDPDAEECFNDVLLKVWNNVPAKTPEKLGAYVAKLTRNAALDKYREQRRKKSIPPEMVELLENCEDIADRGDDPADAGEVAEKIAEFLAGISAEKRKTFILRYYYELTEKEISQKTGLPAGTVSSYLSRTKKALKKRLQKEGVSI